MQECTYLAELQTFQKHHKTLVSKCSNISKDKLYFESYYISPNLQSLPYWKVCAKFVVFFGPFQSTKAMPTRLRGSGGSGWPASWPRASHWLSVLPRYAAKLLPEKETLPKIGSRSLTVSNQFWENFSIISIYQIIIYLGFLGKYIDLWHILWNFECQLNSILILVKHIEFVDRSKHKRNSAICCKTSEMS